MSQSLFCNHTAITVQPSLIIGCGGRGTEAVAYCRDLLQEKLFQNDEKRLNDFTPIRCLALDSMPQNLERNNAGHKLRTIFIACKDRELHNIIHARDGKFPDTPKGVVHIMDQMPKRNYARMIKGLPNSAMGNSTCPPLGSINFLGSWEAIKSKLKDVLKTWQAPFEDRSIPISNEAKSLADCNPQVFLSAGLYGGTGCGIHLHVAALLRVLFKEMEINNAAIYMFFLLPDLVKDADETGKRKLRANAYAALKELDYFAAGNPYRIRTGSGQDDILVTNAEGNDVLFNKIFLINDENQNNIKLNQFEAANMLGEALFHFSGTTLGASFNQRLTNSPYEYCSMEAPEPEPNQVHPESRPRAYSTFGLATTRIPYAVLKNNLIADCAIEIMNACIQLPDDETQHELEQLESQQMAFQNRYLEIAEPLVHIGLDQTTLDRELDSIFSCMDYMDRRAGKRFAEYVKMEN